MEDRGRSGYKRVNLEVMVVHCSTQNGLMEMGGLRGIYNISFEALQYILSILGARKHLKIIIKTNSSRLTFIFFFPLQDIFPFDKSKNPWRFT